MRFKNHLFLISFAFSFILILFFSGSVSAKFVCGKVNPTDSMVPSWYIVNVSHYSNYTSCFVSPEDYKYCCDLDSVSGYSWAEGDLWGARIKNLLTGYVAGPVNLSLGAGAYDVFPEMDLNKVIRVREPSEKIYFDVSWVNYSFDFLNGYDLVEVNSKNVSLTNQSYLGFGNVSYGMNELKINASNGEDVFSEDKSFGVISSFSVERNFNCDGCKRQRVPANKTISVNILVNVSDNLSGMYLREYVPVGWNVVSNESLYSYDSNYNYIEWEVNGSFFNETYLVESPEGFGKEFYFSSSLENLDLGEEKVRVKDLPPAFSSGGGRYSYTPSSFSNAVSGMPIVSRSEGAVGALYPNKSQKDVYFDLNKYNFSNMLFNLKYGFYQYYLVNSNIGNDSFGKMVFDIKVPSKNVSVMGADSSGKFVRLTGNFVSDGTYRVSSNYSLKKIFIYSERASKKAFYSFVDFYYQNENYFSPGIKILRSFGSGGPDCSSGFENCGVI